MLTILILNMTTKTDIVDEKIQVINIILDLYPSLKKDRQNIINVVFGKLNKPNKYVFTKISMNNNIYYVDNFGMLLDESLNFKGIVNNNTIYLFEDNEINKLKEYNKYI
jgi:hypothetical protein